MGRSADVEWETFYEGNTCFFFYHEKMGGIISLTPSKTENLNSIIHEINECELMYLLKRYGIRDSVIHVTKKMCKKYPWVFKRPQKYIYITHIISPYGKGNCILERKKNRVKW
jgi:hypothetical protein